MPIPLIAQGFQEGISSIPYAWTVLKIVPWVLLVAALKYYFGGARNGSERLMHSKVVMVTVCSTCFAGFCVNGIETSNMGFHRVEHQE